MLDIVIEFLKFLMKRKYWLLPIMLILLIFGFLIVLTQGTVFAPLYIQFFDGKYSWNFLFLS